MTTSKHIRDDYKLRGIKHHNTRGPYKSMGVSGHITNKNALKMKAKAAAGVSGALRGVNKKKNILLVIKVCKKTHSMS